MKKIHLFPVGCAAFLAANLPVDAAVGLISLGVNFQHTTGASLAAADVAGVVPQANWNNAAATAAGNIINATADLNGAAVTPTGVNISWTSNNTWASTGAGEENNGFAAGPNRALMTGYLDTEAATVTTVTVTGIPTGTVPVYDVYVYALGGVVGRGGSYTIGSTTLFGDSNANPSSYVRDLGVDHTDTGNYLLFSGLTSTSFVLSASTATGGFGTPPRAPVNAIQIVQRVPEPVSAGLMAFLAGFLGLRRRRC